MLSKEEVKHIALLARIGVKDDEVEKYQEDLSGVLDFFKDLEKADVSAVSVPRQIIGRENGMRGDNAYERAPHQTELIMNNVPETKGKYVKVKSVF
ncbi:MAG: Asp-tRNA(Asn)/Glu-tRNA(Gln) amidotransferase subunit GatC [Candidatus Moranbacteria bacterium]|nr:Asp-tRNA(Asn)/Glu-tRNA(Gln) amidotransferase subunit GatC [Candidatus Moranbacteria bacterium]